MALFGCGEAEPEPSRPTTPAPGNGTPASAPDDELGILTPRVDTTADAVPGGMYQSFRAADTPTFDAYASAIAAGVTIYGAPLLMSFVPGGVEAPATGEVEPYLAEDFEIVDELTTVFRLRQNAVWEDRAPVSGRPVTADDVQFSWERLEDAHVYGTSLAHKSEPAAPVDTIRAIDDYTVEVKTVRPYGLLLQGLAEQNVFQIMPREADGGFDPRETFFSAGPFVMSRHNPDVRIEYRKNPTWWRDDRPFIDGFNMPIIGEYAQQLAQFRAGRIFNGVVRQEDVIETKNEFPELEVYRGDYSLAARQIGFGRALDSPFRDERVRRAISMMVDRELLVEIFANTEEFAAAGWPVEVRIHNVAVHAGYGPFWMDPFGDEHTAEERAAFEYNPDEAGRLLDAAGHRGLRTDFSYEGTRYGPTFLRESETVMLMMNQTGLVDLRENVLDFQTQTGPIYVWGRGDYDGLYLGLHPGWPHAALSAFHLIHRGGSFGWTEFDGEYAFDGSAEAGEMIERALQSFDFDEQIEVVKQLQHHNAPYQPIVTLPTNGSVQPYVLNWPWVKNIGAVRAWPGSFAHTELIHYWLDQTMMPS